MVSTEKSQGSTNALFEAFQELDRSDAPWSEQTHEALRILHRNQPDQQSLGQNVSTQRLLKCSGITTEGLLRWLLKHISEVQHDDQDDETRRSAWALLAQLVENSSEPALMQQLTYTTLLEVVHTELKHIADHCELDQYDHFVSQQAPTTDAECLLIQDETSPSAKRKRKRDLPTEHVPRKRQDRPKNLHGKKADGIIDSIFPAVSSVLRCAHANAKHHGLGQVVSDDRNMPEHVRKQVTAEAEVLAIACNIGCFLADATLDSSTAGPSYVQELLAPFVQLWIDRIACDSLEDSYASSFQVICLGPVLEVCSLFRQRNGFQSTRKLEKLIVHYVLTPAQNVFTGQKDSDDKGKQAAFEKVFQTSIRSLETSQRSGIHDNQPGHASEPLSVLFELAIRSLSSPATQLSRVEENWLHGLFQFLVHGIDGTLSTKKPSPKHPFYRTLKELVWLCQKYKLRLSEDEIHDTIRCMLPRGSSKASSEIDWVAVSECVLLDPYWVTVDSDAKLRSPLAKVLFSYAREIQGDGDKRVGAEGDEAQSNSPYGYDAAVSHFALVVVDVHRQTRKLSHFLKWWKRELQHVYRNCDASSGDVFKPRLMWEDKRIKAAISTHLEPSLTPEQMQTIFQSLTTKLEKLSHSPSPSLSQLRSLVTIISTLILGIRSDEYLEMLASVGKVIHNHVAILICSGSVDHPLARQLWSIGVVLLNKCSGIWYSNGQEDFTTSLVEKASSTSKHTFSKHQSKQGEVIPEALHYLWLSFTATSNTSLGEDFDPAPAGKLLTLLSKAILRSNVSSQDLLEPGSSSIMVTSLVRMIVGKPGLLLVLRSEDRKLFLSAFFKAIIEELETTQRTRSIEPENEIEISQYLTMWTHMIGLDEIRNHGGMLRELAGVEQTCVSEFSKEIGNKSMQSTLCILSQILRKILLEVWDRSSRESLAAHILEKAALTSRLTQAELEWTLTLTVRLLRKPLKSESPIRVVLSAILDRYVQQAKDSPSRKKTNIADTLKSAVQRILGQEETSTTPRRLREHISDLHGLGVMDAANKARDFFKAFAGSTTQDQLDCIASLQRSSKRDLHGSALVYILQICAMKVQVGVRDELRSSFEELVTELRGLADRSQSITTVILALRCIATVQLHNPWVVNQPHIDGTLALLKTAAGRVCQQDLSSGQNSQAPGATPRTRSLDLGSAKRMLLSSLGIRVPKTQAEMDSLRRSHGATPSSSTTPANPDGSSEVEQTAHAAPSQSIADKRIAQGLYQALCDVLSSALQCHRVKVSLRWGLVCAALQALLRTLFEPLPAASSRSMDDPAHGRPWITGADLNADSAANLSRLLGTICDPTPSSVRSSKKQQKQRNQAMELNDVTKKARSLAGRHTSALLLEYCSLRLRAQLDEEKRAALIPGLYAVLEAMTKEVRENLNDILTKPQRDIFKGLLEDYNRERKWHGR